MDDTLKELCDYILFSFKDIFIEELTGAEINIKRKVEKLLKDNNMIEPIYYKY